MEIEVTRSWTVPEIAHLECFRAVGFNHDYGLHCHAAYAIGVVDSGVGGLWHKGTHQRGASGEVFAINPEEPHTGYGVQQDGVSYSLMYVGEELVRNVLPGLSSLPRFPRLEIRDLNFGVRLRNLCRSTTLSTPVLALETRIFSELSYLFARHAKFNIDLKAGREPTHIARMQDYLRTNLKRNVRLQELVSLTGLSKAYIIRLFRRRVGMPPYEWLLQLRIQEARRQLRYGTPIGELALDLGFSDQSHFHRRFKRLTGMTPAAFAKGHYSPRQAAKLPPS